MKFWILALVIAVTSAAGAAELRWPAFGVMDTDEGTLEFWIRFPFDPQQFKDVKETKDIRGQGGLFSFNYGDPLYPHDEWSIRLLSGWAGPAAARIGRVANGVEFDGGYISFGADARRGEWYHFAMAWGRGKKTTIYINGKPVFEMPVTTAHAKRPLPGATITLLEGQAAVDDLRLSCVARKPEELGCGAAGTVRDAATVWFMNFDQPDSLPAGFSYIPGKTGNALALCDKAAFQ